MDKIFFEYLKYNDLEEEHETEKFWLEIKQDIYKIEPDYSLVYFSMRRGHASAYIGEYAGTFIQILLSIPPFILATIELWEKISNHFYEKRKGLKTIRVLNVFLLENLCKYDLYINKGVKNFTLLKSQKLVEENSDNSLEQDFDFSYEETLNKIRVARITFESKSAFHIYTIDSDGEIHSYNKEKK